MIPAWTQKAACLGADTELFFSKDPKVQQKARAYCDRCPVFAECKDDAFATDSTSAHGIRAGLTGRQRRRQVGTKNPQMPRAEINAAKPVVKQLTAEGVPGCEIARRVGVNKRTVLRWCREFKAAA